MAQAKANKKVEAVSVELPECPVCQETMSAPIFQCLSGHSLCHVCSQNLVPSLCPLCRQAMTTIRNWQLEQVISKATVSCPNKSDGCVYNILNEEVEDHLKECIFREMKCPLGAVFGKCSWTGKLKVMLDHFKEHHPQNCNVIADTDININNVSISADERCMYLFSQNKFLFIIQFKLDKLQKMAYWTVQHIGSKKVAQQHIYEIHVRSNVDKRRKVVFTDHCFNDALDANEIFRLTKCGAMPLGMLENFIKDGKLTFSFNIKRNAAPFKKEQTGNKPPQNPKKGPQPKGPNTARGKSPVAHPMKGMKKKQ